MVIINDIQKRVDVYADMIYRQHLDIRRAHETLSGIFSIIEDAYENDIGYYNQLNKRTFTINCMMMKNAIYSMKNSIDKNVKHLNDLSSDDIDNSNMMNEYKSFMNSADEIIDDIDRMITCDMIVKESIKDQNVKFIDNVRSIYDKCREIDSEALHSIVSSESYEKLSNLLTETNDVINKLKSLRKIIVFRLNEYKKKNN